MIENEVALLCVTNYAGTCKGICGYDLVYNFLIQLLPLQNPVFMVHFSNAFWYGNEAFLKVVLKIKLLHSLQSFTCHMVNIGEWKYIFTRVVIKVFSLESHSCCSCSTRVVREALLSHSCRSCLTRVSLVLHSCRSCHTCVVFVSHSCRLCLALVLQTRLDPGYSI